MTDTPYLTEYLNRKKMTRFNFDSFRQHAFNTFLKHPDVTLTLGRHLMNVLHDKHPDVYWQIPSRLNCDGNNHKIPALLMHLSMI